MKVIVGGIIEKNGKVLLVQEKAQKCYGKWNLPAGHLEPNESIMQAAIREIKEETGCDVELTGIATLANRIVGNDIIIEIIFSTKIVNENIKFNPEEQLDVKWWNIEDILNNMDDKLKNINFIKQPIKNIKENKIGTLDIVNII